MDQLTILQKQIGEEIQKLISNVKKDSASRKTSSYYEERINRLESLWKKFEDTDNAIRELPNANLQHAYFTQNYYHAIKDMYSNYSVIFNEQLESVKVQAVPGKSLTTEADQKSEQVRYTSVASDTQQTSTRNIQSPTAGETSSAQGAGSGKIGPTASTPARTAKSIDDVTRLIRRQRSNVQMLHHMLDEVEKASSLQSKQYYQLKSTTIQRYWTNVEECHARIWEVSDDPTLNGYNIDEYFRLEGRTQTTLISMAENMERITTNSTLNNNVSMKLPKIVLPRFDGDYLKWRQFYDLFSQMVHNQVMGNCQKMWYLKTNLSGEAEKLIRHFSLSDENYLAAWDTLKSRYENTRLLVTALLNKLLSQPKLIHESATSIKSLHDTSQECLMGLENIGVSTSSWDALLLHILVRKLDRSTHAAYEQTLRHPRNLQSMKEFLQFLETRFQSLEALGTKGKISEGQIKGPNLSKISNARSYATTATPTPRCATCQGEHKIFSCQRFLQLAPSRRLDLVRNLKLCINCLKMGHSSTQCPSRSCLKCDKRHNTLLHMQETIQDKPKPTQTPSSQSASTQSTSQSVTLSVQPTNPRRGYVLLSTVRVKLTGQNGKTIECRAILDSGSQLNLVSKRVARSLNLVGVSERMSIHGIGDGSQDSQERVSILLESITCGYKARIEAFVLPRILGPQPSQLIDISSWPLPHNIKLADPSFNHPDRVDLLIGAELVYNLLSVGQIKLGEDLPTLQNTVLGWILAGKINETPQTQATCGICSEDEGLDKQIEKFWAIEEVDQPSKILTVAEKRCENYFSQTVERNMNGRFVVRLPFLENPNTLGESKDIAFRRFLSMERRLNKDDNLRMQYVEFMQEYRRLGHMEEVNQKEIQAPYYFLPHHCVIKPDSSTTKLRVVFDASCKTSTNISLNDVLAAGPTVQDELFSILIRFRMPRFVFTADIEKMYRQVLVQEEDRRFQLIYWRDHSTEPLKCYRLNTVTYGTKSAPYLATKCLQRLAHDTAKYPLGSESLQRDVYVDDVMSGSDSLTTALEMQRQLISLLSEAGFKLRKWCANHPRLLRNIQKEDTETHTAFNDGAEETIKILGLNWLPASDSFCIKTTWDDQQNVTKRTAYSDTARLFDPLGIMGPVVVTAKIFLQHLWSLKLDWDASLPMELHTKWINFRQGLRAINNIKFPRHVFSTQSTKSTQFHVFADASQKAYGAAIYIRSVNKDNQIVVRLLCAKSRVAPLKQLTLPRLELCAAKLAVQLTERVKTDLKSTTEAVFYWTDSEIVLSWINSASTSFHTFVANRISAIQDSTHPQQWRHVGSKQNPADILSRGLDPHALENCNLWFYGPPFLHGMEGLWPPPFSKAAECKLEKKKVALPITSEDMSNHFVNKIEHHNSFRRLKRIVGYMLRFINKVEKNTRKTEPAQTSELTAQELDEALAVIIRAMQMEHFNEDISQLKRHGEVNRNSSLTNYAPFLDERGLLRVGGRVDESLLPYDAKHQMVLPYSHPLTKLLMTDIHITNHHAGPQTLLAITQQRFWPVKGKTIARSVVHHCIRCIKAKPKLLGQVMGNLPAHRVQPARPFINAGVDFCGPVWVHYKVRGKRPQKAYIAVFCCFATKATHLELVSDLSTAAFIGALKRFMGRRGHCRHIYCDNATNFIGARNELAELKTAVYSDKSREDIAKTCEVKGTDFHFIPPRAPHFGGLWEAAVKSAKYLLQRTVRAASLTYEELETVVIEVEAILNSRPLTPMSSNPNDLTALTPGHFLIGEPLTSSVDAHAEPMKAALLTRWKLVTHIKNEFWKRWSQEYLSQLQQRHKWNQQHENVLPGTLVIIKDDNLPPLKWPLGRITNVIKGRDGFVRVADVRTANHNIIRRPIHKLAPLPVDNETNTPTESSRSQDSDKDGDKDSNDDNSRKHKPRSSTRAHNSSSSEPSSTSQKRMRHSIGSSLTMLLLALLVLPTSKGLPIEIKAFDSNPGIHFENLGTTYLISTRWTLVVYYDLEPYWMECKYFKNGVLSLGSVCDLMHERKLCDSITLQFTHIKEDLDKGNDLLQPRPRRAKRAPFNIIGNIQSALFGVLDSEYAEKMSQTIEDVKNNENHLLALIKNQTLLLDSTLNVIKGDQVAMRKQFVEFDNRIDQLKNRVNNITQELHESSLSQLFIALSLRTMLMATNLRNTQGSVLEVITDTHHGRISPQLISPQQLREALTKIKENLPPSLRLPVSADETPKLYSLMNVQCQVTRKHAIFKLDLPLLAPEEFELFKLIPVPVLINNTLVAIKPSSTLLVVNLHRDQYYQLDEQELTSCMSLSENVHMCKQRHPIYRRGTDIGSCEIHLLNQLPQPRTCKLMTYKGNAQWIQLHDPNKWIYALREKTPINIVCGDNVSQTTLEGSGTVKLQAGCVIKQEHITIQGHSHYPSATRMSYTPLGNITEFALPREFELLQSNTTVYQTNQTQLEGLQKQLIEQQLQLPTTIAPHDAHQFAVGYIGLLGVVLLGIYLTWRCIPGRPKKARPVPLPRRSLAQDFSIQIEPDDS